MLGTKSQLILLSCLCFIITGIFLFELGLFISREKYNLHISALQSSYEDNIQQMNNKAKDLNVLVTDKEITIQELAENKNELTSELSELSAQIAGLYSNSASYPFSVPSTGTVGSKVSTYLDENNGYYHFGVDFWTTTQNGGAISTHRGNPVYSACIGRVESFQPENGGVTIKCDLIPSSFNMPARRVYTYYGHMANAITKEQYIYLSLGQQVRKGQFIGYQGDLSMFTPQMRNVHLHFSVFSGFKESEGTQDPCKYIGGSCTTVGAFFVNELK